MFVFEGELILDLLELGLYPWIIFVAMGVEFGKIAKTLFDMAMVDQPSRRFGTEPNKEENEGWEYKL